MASLQNSVHPLLSRDKFAKHVNYNKVFLQPARLVTHLLSTPQAQHYLLALITKSKPRSALRGPAKDARHRYWSDKPIEKLSDLDQQCVSTWLLLIAETITYSVRACANGALAETKKLRPSSSAKDQDPNLGYSIIYISRTHHYDPLRGDLSQAERIVRQFNLAIALLHELAHAISYSITCRQDEDFFGTALVAEAGFEFEARIFGACPSYSSHTPMVVRWFPWPSRILLGGEGEVESYDLEDLCCSPGKLEDGGPIARVSRQFMRELFREEFWWRGRGEDWSCGAVCGGIRDLRHLRHLRRMGSMRKLLAMVAKNRRSTRTKRLEK